MLWSKLQWRNIHNNNFLLAELEMKLRKIWEILFSFWSFFSWESLLFGVHHRKTNSMSHFGFGVMMTLVEKHSRLSGGRLAWVKLKKRKSNTVQPEPITVPRIRSTPTTTPPEPRKTWALPPNGRKHRCHGLCCDSYSLGPSSRIFYPSRHHEPLKPFWYLFDSLIKIPFFVWF